MFLAHMPAGYMASKLLLAQFRLCRSKTKWVMFLGILGSVVPDLDMFYFHLVDHGQHTHHSYWTHIPVYWIAILILGYLVATILRSRTLVAAITIFIGCVLIHLLLDTFAGGIQWLHPFSDKYFHIFTIPARYDYWLWNYVFHWTALVEISVIIIAGNMFWRTRKIA